jgi:methylmalonyl-CoA/ethylmalonyl-CoA epimerase
MEGILQNSNLDHIGIIVKDINQAREKFSLLFGNPFFSENLPSQKIILDKYKLLNCTIEVFQPYSDNTTLVNFLAKRGEGIHHICVKNITDQHIAKLKNAGYNLIYSNWEIGSENSKINFVHPSSLCKVLLELKQE